MNWSTGVYLGCCILTGSGLLKHAVAGTAQATSGDGCKLSICCIPNMITGLTGVDIMLLKFKSASITGYVQAVSLQQQSTSRGLKKTLKTVGSTLKAVEAGECTLTEPEKNHRQGRQRLKTGNRSFLERSSRSHLGSRSSSKPALEKLLKGHAGKYATGDEVQLADAFLAPEIEGAITRFQVDMVSSSSQIVRVWISPGNSGSRIRHMGILRWSGICPLIC